MEGEAGLAAEHDHIAGRQLYRSWSDRRASCRRPGKGMCRRARCDTTGAEKSFSSASWWSPIRASGA